MKNSSRFCDNFSYEQLHYVNNDVRVIYDFPTPLKYDTRKIWLYFPSNYWFSNTSYPVLYMTDGPNLFSGVNANDESWLVDKALNKLAELNDSYKMIVVGIEHGYHNRLNELIPWLDGQMFYKWVCYELKPFIDCHFRTLPENMNSYIGGSSLGGSSALQIVLKYSNIFSNALAFSPTYFVLQNLESWNGILKNGQSSIYMDVGTNEAYDDCEKSQVIVNCFTSFYQYLLSNGMLAGNITKKVFSGHIHHETAWQMRFPSAIQSIRRIS